jgi:microcystin-dependent protein
MTAADKTKLNAISICPFPVNALYLSISSANPNTIWSGTTWAAWGSGRVPVGVNSSDTAFNTVEKTGGEKNHTLTESEMPKHRHGIPDDYGTGGAYDGMESNKGNDQNADYHTNYAGGGESHNNLQPYITCYMWKRTG